MEKLRTNSSPGHDSNDPFHLHFLKNNEITLLFKKFFSYLFVTHLRIYPHIKDKVVIKDRINDFFAEKVCGYSLETIELFLHGPHHHIRRAFINFTIDEFRKRQTHSNLKHRAPVGHEEHHTHMLYDEEVLCWVETIQTHLSHQHAKVFSLIIEGYKPSEIKEMLGIKNIYQIRSEIFHLFNKR